MKLSSQIGYACTGVLTIGLSQAIGVIGLLSIGIKAIYDVACKSFYERRLATADKTTNSFYDCQNRIKYYSLRIQDNDIYAKAFALSLISLALNYYYGYLAKSFQSFIADVGSSCIKMITFPLNGKSHTPDMIYSRNNLQTMYANTELLFLETQENDKEQHCFLETLWIPSDLQTDTNNAKTVILFHGNEMVSTACREDAINYHLWGLNVLLINMAGYPGSRLHVASNTDSITSSELRSTYTVEAAMRFVQEKTRNQDNSFIYFHGISLGGGLACKGGAMFPGSHVIAEQTFTSLSATAKAIMEKVFPLFAEAAQKGMEAVVPVGDTDGKYTTDGYNNLNKVPFITGAFLAIGARNDKLMTYKNAEGTTRSFAEDLADQYLFSHKKTTWKKKEIFLLTDGEHYEHPVWSNTKTFEGLANFLKKTGAIA